jgi:hypothetical protein
MSNLKISLPCAAYTGKEPYIFISYSHIDEGQVYREIEALDERGCRIWYDVGIDPCSEWREEVARAITDSAMFIVFITRNSIQSRNVIKEINFAIDEMKPFLAVHLEEVSLPPGLRLTMGDIQALQKWKLAEDDYWRKLQNVLPVACLEKAGQVLSGDGVINDTDMPKPVVKRLLAPPGAAPVKEPVLKDIRKLEKTQAGIRDLTPDFLPKEPLNLPVKVFHQKIQPDETIQPGAIVFILNPVKLSQLELKFLLQYNACFVLLIDSSTERVPLEQHPIKLLLEHKNANRLLERIKGLHKNVLELHIVPKKPWNLFGGASSGQPLFRMRNRNFCFKEYPLINEETLALDEVFIQEIME